MLPNPKTFKLKKPLDNFVAPIDMLLETLSKESLRGFSGTYVGTGASGQVVSIPFVPKLIIISPQVNITTADVTITGNMVFTLVANVGASWIPGTGFVKNCVLATQNKQFTIGSNAAVNTATQTYLFYIIG